MQFYSTSVGFGLCRHRVLGLRYVLFSSAFLLLLSVLYSASVFAQQREVLEYEYDAAGHISGIEAFLEDQPPRIDQLSPSRIARERLWRLRAQGMYLRQVQVRPAHPGITISEVQSSDTQVDFTLYADAQVPVGAQTLHFQSSLGSVGVPIEVRPALPILGAYPTPLVVGIGSRQRLRISLSRADAEAHTVQLRLLTGTEQVGLSASQLTLAAGHLDGLVELTGLSAGSARLQLSSISLDQQLELSVQVQAPRPLPAGSYSVQTRPVGVLRRAAPSQPELSARGPILGGLLGVQRGAERRPPALPAEALYSPLLGVARGPLAQSLHPDFVIAGEQVELELSGFGLSEVEAVGFDSIHLQAQRVRVSADGRRLQVQVQAQSAAARGAHQVELYLPGAVAVAQAEPLLLWVSEAPPVVVSIEPLQIRPQQRIELVVHGQRLVDVQSVELAPGTGLQSGGLRSEGSTELRLELAALESAAPGRHAVIVHTRSGSSAREPSEANTLEVSHSALRPIEPLLSAALGVRRGSAAVERPRPAQLPGPLLGVGRGALLSGITPAVVVVGTEVELELTGQGLDRVEQVSIEPAGGLELLGTAQVGEQGRSLRQRLRIDSQAELQVRSLKLRSAGGRLAVAPGADRLRLSAPVPELISLSPLRWVRGQSGVIRLRGRFLSGAVQVRVQPATGVTLGRVRALEPGVLEVQWQISATAPLGGRVVIVRNEAGASPSEPSPSNTVQLVAELGVSVEPLLSASLGVRRGARVVVPDVYFLPSALVGVRRGSPAGPPASSLTLPSAPLGLVRGPYARSLDPPTLVRGESARLRILGAGLDQVSQVQLRPSAGITLSGPAQVGSGAEELIIELELSAGVAPGLREVVLQRAGRPPLRFRPAQAGRLQVLSEAQPRIDSIEPIQEVVGQSLELVIRGQYLQGGRLQAKPGTGLAFGQARVDADGRRLRVQLNIQSDAPLGARVIIVRSASGQSSGAALAANTFTILGRTQSDPSN